MNSSLRRAALTLHALGERDQRWLLAKLPAPQSMALSGLLKELRALGVPADALSGLDSMQGIGSSDESENASKPRWEAIEGERFATWAAKEADWMVAQVIAAVSPSQSAALLDFLEVHRKQYLEKLCTEIRPMGGLIKDRLLAKAHAEIRAAQPMEKHVPMRKTRISKWLPSFVRRA